MSKAEAGRAVDEFIRKAMYEHQMAKPEFGLPNVLMISESDLDLLMAHTAREQMSYVPSEEEFKRRGLVFKGMRVFLNAGQCNPVVLHLRGM